MYWHSINTLIEVYIGEHINLYIIIKHQLEMLIATI